MNINLWRCHRTVQLYILHASFNRFCEKACIVESHNSIWHGLHQQNRKGTKEQHKWMQAWTLNKQKKPLSLSSATTWPIPSTSRAYRIDLNPDAAKACKVIMKRPQQVKYWVLSKTGLVMLFSSWFKWELWQGILIQEYYSYYFNRRFTLINWRKRE